MMNYLTEEELSQTLSVGRTTLWQLRREGLPYLHVRGCVRYRLDEVENWLRERAGMRGNGMATSL